MDIIITFVLVCIASALLLLIGNFFGQGAMIGYLLYSDDSAEVSVGKNWHDSFMWALKNETGLFDRLVIRIVLAGVTSYGDYYKESCEECRDA